MNTPYIVGRGRIVKTAETAADIDILIRSVLCINSTSFRGYPAGTLLVQSVTVSFKGIEFVYGRGVEFVYAITICNHKIMIKGANKTLDFNAVPLIVDADYTDDKVES